jgi:tetratricopeptide (TPR) repeat protein
MFYKMTANLKTNYFPLSMILLLALLLRIIYLGEIWDTPDFSHPGLDSAYHIYWARGMATGDWSAFEGRENPMIYRYPYYRPPGYVYFLSIVYLISGMGSLWPRLIQFGLGLGSILLVFYLARRIFDKITGLIAAFLASFYWIFIYYEGELVGVSWAVFLSLLSALLLLRSTSRWSLPGFFFAGLVLGVLVIFRPNALILYPVSVAWIFLISRHRGDKPRVLLPSAGLLLGIVIAILPVTIRNYVVAGEFVPISTNAGISLGVANNEFTDGTTHFIPGIGNIGTPYDWPRIVRGLSHDLGRHLTHREASNYLSRQAIEFAWRNPGRFFHLLGRKTLLFWGPMEVRNLKEVHYARIHSPLLRFLPGNFTLVLTLALLGVIILISPACRKNRGQVYPLLFSRRMKKQRNISSSPPLNQTDRKRAKGRLDPYLLVLFIGGYFISMVPFAAAARYRVPVIPFLIILGAIGVRRNLKLLTERKWGLVAVLAAVGVVLYLILSLNFSGFSPAPEKWHYDRGLARLESGGYQDAVREFDLALEYKPDYGAAYTNRGVALSKSGDPSAAILSYRRALALEPDSPRPLKNLADALLDQGDPAEALILYRRALELAPGYSGIACDLARALSNDGREEEAIACYREILRSDPESIRAHLELGNLLLELNQSNAARGHYQEALKINPASSNARYNLGNLLIEEGKTEEGIACYREVIRRDPDHIDARNNLGVQLARGGNAEEATVYLLEAIRIAPRDPAAYYNLAVILAGAGKNDEAIPYLEKVLELSPDYAPARRALAVLGGRQ